MVVLGISSFYHDSSATVIINDKIVASAQEERFTRIKHDNRFPLNAIDYCLKEAKVNLGEIDTIVYYENPSLKLLRILKTNLIQLNFLFLLKFFFKIKNFLIKKKIKNILENFYSQKLNKIKYNIHHHSHALSTFIPSGFDEALVICFDGVGEFHSTTVWHAKKGKLKLLWRKNFPDSIGIIYSAFTYFCGFKVNFGEYKLMGLAPYGKPIYVDLIKKNIVKVYKNGEYKVNTKYFNFSGEKEIISKSFEDLFNVKKRNPEEKIKQIYMDIAASIQLVTEEIVLNICKTQANITGLKKLCLSGGVALNCVSNGNIEKEKIFNDIWVQPASGDAGCSLGAALIETKKLNEPFSPYLGPRFSDDETEELLKLLNIKFIKYEKFEKLVFQISKNIQSGQIIGWFQGKMEFGPRALGNRSILADPRNENIQSELNLKIKFRESFRPFAPIILEEEIENYFDFKIKSPYMLFTSKIKDKFRIDSISKSLEGLEKINEINSKFPGITHVDFSSRLQTVSMEDNLKLYSLLKNFYDSTGCPMLINTSFNVRSEPIVCTPLDSIKCFMNTNIDILVINNFVIEKKDIDFSSLKDIKYLDQFDLD
jgi:carbamoyltransferase